MRWDETGVEIRDTHALASGAHAARRGRAIPDFVGADKEWTAKSVQFVNPFALDRNHAWQHSDDLRFLGGQASGDTTVGHHEVMSHFRRAADGGGDCLDVSGLLRLHLLEGSLHLRR